MSSTPCFAYDNEKHLVIAPGNIITGDNINYLLLMLCSKTYYYALRQFYMGGGIEGELKTNRLEILPVPLATDFSGINSNNINIINEYEVDELIYNYLHFSAEEIDAITSSKYFI